jgi:hypothetical protein
MSSRYMCMKRPMTSWNIDVISRWNVAGALQSPCCIMRLTYVPAIVTNAVLSTSCVRIRTCSYASDKSILDRILARATSSRMTSWSGKGIMSLTVLSFHCHASTTVRRCLSFLCMHNIGAAWLTGFGSHHPALTYRLTFSWNSSLSEFRHRGR